MLLGDVIGACVKKNLTKLQGAHDIWDNPSKIKSDIGGGNEITVFDFIIVIPCGSDFKLASLFKSQ